MPFVWDNYSTLAEKILEKGSTDESLLRAGVSRIYYAAFHKASLFAERNLGYEHYGKSSQHSALPQNFCNQTGNLDYQEVCSYLRDMRERRVYCDYRLGTENVTKKLKSSVLDFKEIERILKEQENI